MTTSNGNESWHQLTFEGDGHSTKPMYYIPDAVTMKEISTQESGPRFISQHRSTDTATVVDFQYDIGPLNILTKSQAGDTISVKITWTASAHSSVFAQHYRIQVAAFSFNFNELFEKSGKTVITTFDRDQTVFCTAFLEGIRSAVRAVKPPVINVQMVINTSAADAFFYMGQMALYLTMRRFNSVVYYKPVTRRSDFLRSLRLWELFQEPNPHY